MGGMGSSRDPYGPSSSAHDPYGPSGGRDPYGPSSSTRDPYGDSSRRDPYGGSPSRRDPYGDPHHSSSRDPYGSDPVYGGGAHRGEDPYRDELGVGHPTGRHTGSSALDDLRHRDRLGALGVDQPRSGLAVLGSDGVQRPGDRPLFPSTGAAASVPRGFSFSLSDMPDPNGISNPRRGRGAVPPGGPYPHEQSRPTQPTWQRWNPMEGIKRHWAETPEEAKLAMPHTQGVTPYGNLSHMPYEKALQELNKTEGHVETLRMKIAHLENGLLSGFPGEGQFKVVVPLLLENGTLGLTLRGTTVTQILDPRAEAFGWCVGDRILKINEMPVSTGQDFHAELQRSSAAHRMSGRPMVFDVFRPSALGVSAPYYAHGGMAKSLSPHRFVPPFHQSPVGSPLVPPRPMSPLGSYPHPMAPPVLPHTLPLSPHMPPMVPHHSPAEAQNNILRSQTNVLSHENAVLRAELAAARARESVTPLSTRVAPLASPLGTSHAPLVTPPLSSPGMIRPASPTRELPRTRISQAPLAPSSVATAPLQARPARASSPTYHSASAPSTAPRLTTFVGA